MATCPECKSEVPMLASRCKHCTTKLSPLTNIIIWIISFFIMVGALFLLAEWLIGLVVSAINFPLVFAAKLIGYELSPSWWQTLLLLGAEVAAVAWIYKKFKSKSA